MQYLYIDPCYLKGSAEAKLKLVRSIFVDDGDHLVANDHYEEWIGSDSGTVNVYQVLDESVVNDIDAGLSGYALTDDAESM